MLKNIFNKYGLIIVLVVCFLIYLPSLSNFFSGDDWFHLRVIQINNFGDFFNFFSFGKTDQSISFYRPLSTQVFFWLFYKLFGLHSLPYYFLGITLLLLIILNIYKLIKELGVSNNIALISVFLYGMSATNFTRINFISAYQELFLTLFVVLGLRFYLKNNYMFLLFFILGLLSKETAIVFLGLMFLVDFLKKRSVLENLKKYFWVGLISVVYLILRIKVFQVVGGDSYIWDFSLKKAVNTLMWYGLWSLGTPEFLVDYVGSGLKVVPKFFSDIPFWSKIILVELGTVLTLLTALVITNLKYFQKNYQLIIFGLGFFGLTLLPVLFLPWHKFTHALSLPMIGLVLILAWFLSQRKILGGIFVLGFVVINLTSNYLLWGRHYSVTRGEIAKKIYVYFLDNYPKNLENKNFRFINDTNPEAKQWGSSKQVSYALSGSDFFKVFYGDNKLKVYYDDLDKEIPENTINLSSKMFLE